MDYLSYLNVIELGTGMMRTSNDEQDRSSAPENFSTGMFRTDKFNSQKSFFEDDGCEVAMWVMIFSSPSPSRYIQMQNDSQEGETDELE